AGSCRGCDGQLFEEKLASIINSVGADQAFLPPMPDRVYRDAASLGHFRDGAHTAFPEPVESALESVTDLAGRSGVRPDCPSTGPFLGANRAEMVRSKSQLSAVQLRIG